jgi:hypothetical protein
MSTHGDFIDYLVFRESSIPTRKKVTLPPLSEVTRKKVTFGPMWKSHTRINVAFGRALTRKKVTGERGKRWL